MGKLKRIILHWTAGTYYPNQTDLEHYHYLIDKDGKIYNGKYKPEDNLNCKDGKYAQHTGGGNTGAIGVGLCGMYGYFSPIAVGKFPLTAIQIEACFKLVAELCKKYDIPITPDAITTHYEFNKKYSIKTGKIDITYLPSYSWVVKDDVASFIRNKIKWYYHKVTPFTQSP